MDHKKISHIDALINSHVSYIGCFLAIVSILILYRYHQQNQINPYIFWCTLIKAVAATGYFTMRSFGFAFGQQYLNYSDKKACDREILISMAILQMGDWALTYMKLSLIQDIPKSRRAIIHFFCMVSVIVMLMLGEGELRKDTDTQDHVCINHFPVSNLAAQIITKLLLLTLTKYVLQEIRYRQSSRTRRIIALTVFFSILISKGAIISYFIWWPSELLAVIEHLSIASKCAIYLIYYGADSITHTPPPPPPSPTPTPSITEYSYSHNDSKDEDVTLEPNELIV